MTSTAPGGMRTPSTEFRYDAFISYSGSSSNGGTQIDRRMAKKLAKLLRGYRTPRPVNKQDRGRPFPKKLKKIFLDSDQMNAGGRLHDTLAEELGKSRYLIVVCSPRAQASRWVNEEIQIFSMSRGPQHVLPLLIEGTPEEAFPPALLGGGTNGEQMPLNIAVAADIRSNSVRKSVRMLSREKLRLIAPILGYSFEELYGNERRRAMWRLTALASLSTAVCAILAVLLVQWNIALNRARNNYDLALKAGAQLLPALAMDFRDLPNRKVALEAAAEIFQKLCTDSANNADCFKILRATGGALGAVNSGLGLSTAADAAYEKSEVFGVPVALRILREWRKGTQKEDLFSALEINSRRNALTIWEQQGIPPKVADAVSYTEHAAEYLQVLDMKMQEGRSEARRVLTNAARMFENVTDPEKITAIHRDLRRELDRALARLDTKR